MSKARVEVKDLEAKLPCDKACISQLQPLEE